jgi:hypothetical protein
MQALCERRVAAAFPLRRRIPVQQIATSGFALLAMTHRQRGLQGANANVVSVETPHAGPLRCKVRRYGGW